MLVICQIRNNWIQEDRSCGSTAEISGILRNALATKI